METGSGFDVAAVDRIVAGDFGVSAADLWQDVVQLHSDVGRFVGYDGVMFIRRHALVRVSTAPKYLDIVRDHVGPHDPASTLNAELGLELRGPAWHGVVTASTLQHRPRPSLTLVEGSDLLPLHDDETEWSDAGFLKDEGRRFGATIDGELVGAANLASWGTGGEDIGVLVAPAYRGMGLGADIAAGAALVAFRAVDFVRYRYACSNGASAGVARRIGAQYYCDQWALRPAL